MKKIISISLLLAFILSSIFFINKAGARDISKRAIAVENWSKIHSHTNALIAYEIAIYYHIYMANEKAKEKCTSYDEERKKVERGIAYKKRIIKALQSFRESLEEIALISNLETGPFDEALFLMSVHHLSRKTPLWTELKKKGYEYERDSEYRLGVSTALYDMINTTCK